MDSKTAGGTRTSLVNGYSSRCKTTVFRPWVARCSGARSPSIWHASWRAPGRRRGAGGGLSLLLLRGAATLPRKVDERLRGGCRYDERAAGTQPAPTRYRSGFHERSSRLPGLGALRADECLLVARASRLRVRICSGLSKRQSGADWLPVGALALPLRGSGERETTRKEQPEPASVSGA